jgi:hypothetical protein
VHYQVQVKRFFLDKELVLDANGNADASLEYWD